MISKFFEEFKEVKNDVELIDYLIEIIIENLKEYYKHNISNKTSNLFNNSNFIESVKYFITYYKNFIKQFILSMVEEKSKIFLDIQAKIEIENGNIEINNKRKLSEFKKTTENFLKKNFYYISQKLMIRNIIENVYVKFFNQFNEEIEKMIIKLLDIKNKSKDNKEIESFLKHTFFIKLKNCGDKLHLKFDENNKENIEYPKIENREEEEKNNNNNLNTNSFIFNINDNNEMENQLIKKENINYYKDDKNWFPIQNKKIWKYINNSDKLSLDYKV